MRTARAAALLTTALVTSSCQPRGSAWSPDTLAVVVESADPGVQRAAADLARLIGASTGVTPEIVASAGETDAPHPLLVGDGPWGCPSLTLDAYQVSKTAHDGRLSLRFCGGSALGTQYAVYEWLHGMGVRFVHPEQTYVPKRTNVPTGTREGEPSFALRGYHIHTQHPLELLEALVENDEVEVERAHRYIDWLVANRQNALQWILLDSVPESEWKQQAARITEYAHRRGVLVIAQTSFTSEQQNAHRVIDTADAIDDFQQIRDGIDSIMEAGFDGLCFNLGSSEFSETDPDQTIAWMNEAAGWALEQHGVPAFMVNHVPAGLYVPEYDVNFFDLGGFAEPEAGAYVHTTMFYGLRGPAPVYGNTSFERQASFLAQELAERQVVYYPESAWWLTFDDTIPLFLPIYVERRIDDLNFLSTFEGVDGHMTFSSGWEWGYWLTDLAIARGTWAPEKTYDEILDDVLGPFGNGAASRVTRLAAEQKDALLDGGLTPFLTGEDVPTEIGVAAGIVFHPLVATPQSVLALTAEDLDSYAAAVDDLADHCVELSTLAAEWRDAAGDGLTPHDVVFPQAGLEWARPAAVIGKAPVLEEFRDATEITSLRCDNALLGQQALVAARRAALGQDPGGDPAALLAQARALTQQAQQIVLRREIAYRYEPERVSSDAQVNATDYDYRVNGRTHRLFFWHYRDDAIQNALDGLTGGLSVSPVQFLAGAQVTVDPSHAGFDEGSTVDIAWGDGAVDALVVDSGSIATHVYGTAGQITLSLDAVASGQSVELDVRLSSALAIYDIPSETVTLTVPDNELASNAILAFVPDFELGVNSTSGAFVASLARDRDADGLADFGTVDHLPPGTRTGDDVSIAGVELVLPVETATGRIGTIRIQDATFAWTFTSADTTITACTLAGDVPVSVLVAVIVATGVLEEEGALNILADIFGFDAASPPPTVAVELSLAGQLQPP